MSIRFRAKTLEGWTVDSPLEAFKFPAGEAHIKGVDAATRYRYQLADVRGMSHDDLFTLAMWADAANERDEDMVVFLPYLPGARADRGVPLGAGLYADFVKELVAPKQIITLDPHSELALDEWTSGFRTKVTVFPFERIIRQEIQDGSSDSKPVIYDGVIAPDKGAVDRATRAARVMGVPVYTAGKTRDFETGQLTGFHMEDELPAEGRFLIVDDICDGGGTFIGLAESIYGPNGPVDNPIKLDLWVTHGVFSKGLRHLSYLFREIHTTDSYASTEDLFAQHIHDHDVHDLTQEPFLNVHVLAPYLHSAIDL